MFWIPFAIFGFIISLRLLISIRRSSSKKAYIKVAFLHPFCIDCAGGEKVLWYMVKALIDNVKDIQVAIYSVEGDKDLILRKAKERFSVDLTISQKYGHLPADRIVIVHCPYRFLLKPLPVFSLLFQLFLPAIYTTICLLKYQPDVMYDTTGYPPCFPTTKILSPGTKCVAYVHYPFTYSEALFENPSSAGFLKIAQQPNTSLLRKGLNLYRQVMLKIYIFCRYFVDYAHTNSSWTQKHMEGIWGPTLKNNLKILFPPCSVQPLLQLKKQQDRYVVTSLAQFRPEKRQIMQARIFHEVIKRLRSKGVQENKLPLFKMVGSVRGEDDQRLLKELQDYVEEHNLKNYVSFHINMPFDGVMKVLGEATHGLHTMQAQHFGISCVEMLAAGILLIAHNSAGPRADIIRETKKEEERCGWLAETEEDYARMLYDAITNNQERVRKNARKRAIEFSNESFMEKFLQDFSAFCSIKQQ